jgi:hypothetical protein
MYNEDKQLTSLSFYFYRLEIKKRMKSVNLLWDTDVNVVSLEGLQSMILDWTFFGSVRCET